jgi:hypothetical protein
VEKLLVFNESAATSPDLDCYRFVKDEDNQFIVFQSRYQLTLLCGMVPGWDAITNTVVTLLYSILV